ncbi:hypothetical protein E2C01_067034 [Portunus trituberculatus]|uniref:Uncharacterized protein n=1 Tax=Portunus trituberculatus TaxID=210409 RepID=A0A5B7HN33_PORTR|nr:hypothetical protein [Portunus trituberculatus]
MAILNSAQRTTRKPTSHHYCTTFQVTPMLVPMYHSCQRPGSHKLPHSSVTFSCCKKFPSIIQS